MEPSARGLGVGTRLVEEVIRHARRAATRRSRSGPTTSCTAARRIYERAGFTLTHEAPNRAFGHDLIEQTWSLTLSAWTETS